MLQRAASNAYSWWWASHIRTKQSKWLEQNLQDMEEKVQNVLQLIQEDGDSFAKRAEMYYKKRPELINFVEESYRAYRALAERYEKMSTDLQNANTTIASVFPEQVQISMDDEDDDGSMPDYKPHRKSSEAHTPSIPKVPAPPKKDLKNLLTTATKKLQSNKGSQKFKKFPAKSGLTEGQAIGEIDKLQKEILTMQTEKEFVKSSYENGLARYWDIDKKISDMQESITSLQDEFNVGSMIEDDEARTLMASKALRSCQDTLDRLEEKQMQSAEDAKSELQKTADDAQNKLEDLTEGPHTDDVDQSKPFELLEFVCPGEVLDRDQSSEQMQGPKQKQDQLKGKGFKGSLSMTEMAEKIDELVQQVINLETSFSSQNVHIQRLRTEADELQKQVLVLESHKAALIDGTNSLTRRLQEMEEKARRTAELEDSNKEKSDDLIQPIEKASGNPFGSFSNNSLLGDVNEYLVTGMPETNLATQNEDWTAMFDNPEFQVSTTLESHEQSMDVETVVQGHTTNQAQAVVATIAPHDQDVNQVQQPAASSQGETVPISPEVQDRTVGGNTSIAVENGDTSTSRQKLRIDGDEPNWQELFMTSLPDKEKVILRGYTNTLRNYKDLKKKLTDTEKKNNKTLLEFVSQVRELRSAISKKDEEIQSLHQKLKFLKEHKDSLDQLNFDAAETKDGTEGSSGPETSQMQPAEGNQDKADDDRVVNEILSNRAPALSPIEEKFRSNIDELLEENLNFWLRFSSSFHQVQKFQTEVEDLQAELSKIEEKTSKRQDGSTSKHWNLKSEVIPLYKHLSEINTEISVWLEQSVLLKDELQNRFSSLCNIQDKISAALVASCGVIEEAMFTSHQAAKFQGEVLNMKQENNKVEDELQSAIEHATRIQLEIEKTLAKLDEDYKIADSKTSRSNQPQLTHSESRNRVPLQSFIFGVKPKRPRYSIFNVMHPAMLKRHHDLKTSS